MRSVAFLSKSLGHQIYSRLRRAAYSALPSRPHTALGPTGRILRPFGLRPSTLRCLIVRTRWPDMRHEKTRLPWRPGAASAHISAHRKPLDNILATVDTAVSVLWNQQAASYMPMIYRTAAVRLRVIICRFTGLSDIFTTAGYVMNRRTHIG